MDVGQDEVTQKKKRKSKKPPAIEVSLEELMAIMDTRNADKDSKKRKRKDRRLAFSIDLEKLLALAEATEARSLEQGERKNLTAAILVMYSALHPRPRSSEKQRDLTDNPQESPKSAPADKSPTKHRGRKGPEDYPDADRLPLELEGITEGQYCPCGCGGKLYRKKDSNVLQFIGQAPIKPVVLELERYRCSSCGEIFKAKLANGEKPPRNDPTAISMVALLKYGSGFPFYRLGGFLGYFGQSIAASTQFAIVAAGIPAVKPAFEEMIRQGAQADRLDSDDTSMKILKFDRPEKYAERTGIHTTGILCTQGKQKIAIFVTGAQHAGENMADILKLRAKDLPLPIQMSDGLSHNSPKLSHPSVVAANCLSHGRRYFVDIVDFFPKHCLLVLDSLGTVFHHDALAKEQELSPEDRLFFHQVFSKPIMDRLNIFMQSELDEKRTESNSRLGRAFNYMLKHWEKLTLFLRVAGAPLDNNAVERQLKKAVLHRKNSLFYRSKRGAEIGDIYMSLIYTCELNGANAYDYLTELQRHAKEVAASPAEWMPWSYRDTLDHIQRVRDQGLLNKGSPIAA